jgi:hypothetical protein
MEMAEHNITVCLECPNLDSSPHPWLPTLHTSTNPRLSSATPTPQA